MQTELAEVIAALTLIVPSKSDISDLLSRLIRSSDPWSDIDRRRDLTSTVARIDAANTMLAGFAAKHGLLLTNQAPRL